METRSGTVLNNPPYVMMEGATSETSSFEFDNAGTASKALFDMLTAIKTEVHEIKRDMVHKDDIKLIEKQMSELDTKLDSVMQDSSETNNEVIILKNKTQELENSLEKTKKDFNEMRRKYDKMVPRLVSIEDHSRRENLILMELPKTVLKTVP